MTNKKWKDLLAKALQLDESDPLKNYVQEFSRPSGIADLRGNSLGFMPKRFPLIFANEAHKWGNLGHDGHLEGKEPWWIYGEQYEKPLAELLGCNGDVPEAVIGNSLSINNFLLILFALWKKKQEGRTKVVTIATIFPSDLESIKSALRIIHGKMDIDEFLVIANPRGGETYDFARLCGIIGETKNLALGFFEMVNYKSGERFPVQDLAKQVHANGGFIGLDLAHGIGNMQLHMTDWNIDFSTFCSYKYLNGGPGGVAGFYIKEALIAELALLLGWWGIDKDTRFGPTENYKPAKGARRFLASNDPIFNSLGLKANLEIVTQYSFAAIEEKHKTISTYLYDLLSCIPQVGIITPTAWEHRGCQISFTTPQHAASGVLETLAKKHHCFGEIRGDILRAAPVAYNTYTEAATFAQALAKTLN